jgi:hypothetical protein
MRQFMRGTDPIKSKWECLKFLYIKSGLAFVNSNSNKTKPPNSLYVTNVIIEKGIL